MEILNADCKSIDWGEPDVLICDPPYSEHTHSNATSQSAGGGARRRDLGFESLSDELRLWTCELAAKVNRWSVIFSDLESITLWKLDLESAGATYIRTIPWIRWSMPSLVAWPPQGAEAIIVAYGKGKGRKIWNGPGNLTHFNQTCLRGEGKHKTEKPLDLMLDLVSFFSNEGELVVDPFSGSGTTGLACQILGRQFKGTELDPEWTKKANVRIDYPDRLSDRDQERYNRWQESQVEFLADKERRRAINERARYKNKAAAGR